MKDKILNKLRKNLEIHVNDGYTFNILELAKIIIVEKNKKVVFSTKTKEEYKQVMEFIIDSDIDDLELALFNYWFINKK